MNPEYIQLSYLLIMRIVSILRMVSACKLLPHQTRILAQRTRHEIWKVIKAARMAKADKSPNNLISVYDQVIRALHDLAQAPNNPELLNKIRLANGWIKNYNNISAYPPVSPFLESRGYRLGSLASDYDRPGSRTISLSKDRQAVIYTDNTAILVHPDGNIHPINEEDIKRLCDAFGLSEVASLPPPWNYLTGGILTPIEPCSLDIPVKVDSLSMIGDVSKLTVILPQVPEGTGMRQVRFIIDATSLVGTYPTPPVPGNREVYYADGRYVPALTFARLIRCLKERTSKHFEYSLDWMPEQWTNATAGEVGELCNLVKKASIETQDAEFLLWRGAIGKEWADVIIYGCLGASQMGYDVERLIRDKFNEVSSRVGSTQKL